MTVGLAQMKVWLWEEFLQTETNKIPTIADWENPLMNYCAVKWYLSQKKISSWLDVSLISSWLDVSLVGLPHLVDGHKAPLRRRSKGRGRAVEGKAFDTTALCGRPRRLGATQGGGGMRWESSSWTLQM